MSGLLFHGVYEFLTGKFSSVSACLQTKNFVQKVLEQEEN